MFRGWFYYDWSVFLEPQSKKQWSILQANQTWWADPCLLQERNQWNLRSRIQCSLYIPPTALWHRQLAALWKQKHFHSLLLVNNSQRCSSELKESTERNLFLTARIRDREQQNCLQSSPNLNKIFLQRQTSRGQTISQSAQLEPADGSNHHLHTKDGLRDNQDRPEKCKLMLSIRLHSTTEQLTISLQGGNAPR